MILLARNMTKNFIKKYEDRSINGLPIIYTASVENMSLNEYLDQIVMKMNTDA